MPGRYREKCYIRIRTPTPSRVRPPFVQYVCMFRYMFVRHHVLALNSLIFHNKNLHSLRGVYILKCYGIEKS
jgi:hypothetical protein